MDGWMDGWMDCVQEKFHRLHEQHFVTYFYKEHNNYNSVHIFNNVSFAILDE